MTRALRFLFLCGLCFAMVLCVLHEVRASGSTTITEEQLGVVKKVVFAWAVGDSTGDVDTSTVYDYNGLIERVVVIPDTGDAAPNDDCDLRILDRHGADMLNLALSACDSATTTQVLRCGGANGLNKLGCVANEPLRLYIDDADSANAVDYASGQVIVYIR